VVSPHRNDEIDVVTQSLAILLSQFFEIVFRDNLDLFTHFSGYIDEAIDDAVVSLVRLGQLVLVHFGDIGPLKDTLPFKSC